MIEKYTVPRRLFAVLTIGLILSFSAFAQGDGFVRKSKDRVPNSYIVVFKDGLSQVDQLLPGVIREQRMKRDSAALTQRYGGAVDRVFHTALRGFSARMSSDQAKAMSSDPSVSYVEEDFVVRADQSQANPPWGLDRIDQRYSNLNQTYNYNTTGTGVRAYVIDSGIRSTHTEFGGRVVFGADFVGDGQNGNDCDGHGTHVAGTIGGATYGVAKNVTLHNVRVLGCDGQGTGAAVLAAVDWVTANRIGPSVVNMSLGTDEPSPTVENAITNSIAQGLHYTLAAGNGDPAINACNHSPGGRVPTAITVAATARGDMIAWFSNYGPCVNLFAPGEDIYSAWNSSDTAIERLSGTSMAAPHVAGVIARLLQGSPTASPAQVKAALLTWASPVVVNGGQGSPRALLYANTSLTTSPPVSAIRIPHGGTSIHYPSEFVVSGAPTVLSTKPGSLQLNINGFTALEANHVVFSLVGPDGTAMIFQNSQQSAFTVFGVSYCISDVGRGGHLSYAIQDGWCFRASDMGRAANFPAPGPGTNYVRPGPLAPLWETLAATYGGKNPNGTWKLFIYDNGEGGTHFDSTIEGWSISVTNPPDPYPIPPPPSPTPTPSPTPVGSPTPPGPPTVEHDVVRDFSTTNNPNGPWSYGFTRINRPEFNLWTNNGEPWNGIRTWSAQPGGFCCGMVSKNFGSPIVYYGTIAHEPDYLYLETGRYGGNAVVRWVAPAAGTYYIRGRYKALDTYYGGIHVMLRRFGGWTPWSSHLPGYGSQKGFNLTLSLAANEPVDFELGEINAPYYYGAGLQATIMSWDAQPPRAYAEIRGRVTNSLGRPLANVRVAVTLPDGSEYLRTTNSSGFYTLRNIATGDRVIRFTRKAEPPTVRNITLNADIADFNVVIP